MASSSAPDGEAATVQPQPLRRMYPWLFTSKAASISDAPVRRRYAQLLSMSEPLLHQYDVSSTAGRTPHMPKNPAVIEPCLTLRAAAIRAVARRPRLQADAAAVARVHTREGQLRAEVEAPLPKRDGGQLPVGGPSADDLWARKQATQRDHLAFVRSLRQDLGRQASVAAEALAVLPVGTPGRDADEVHENVHKEHVQQQLVYQIGITDDWLQLRHLFDIFASDMRPTPCAAMLRQLAALLAARSARERMSPDEGAAYAQFSRDLVACATAHAHGMTAAQMGHAAYAVAVLEVSHGAPLLAAIVQASGVLFRLHVAHKARGDAAAQPHVAPSPDEAAPGPAPTSASAATPSLPSERRQVATSASDGSTSLPPSDGSQLQPPIVAADFASLAWALGTLGYAPPVEWCDALCAASIDRLQRFQPTQLWGTVWGLARVGHVPPDVWMQRALQCARACMGEFDADGLAHLVWALGAMGYVPDKPWLRALVGQVRAKHRSLQPDTLVELFEGLAAVGYRPRPEICWSLESHARRYLHAFTPAQLAALLRSMAQHASWAPTRQLLYDFVTQSQPRLAAMSAAELASVLWSFAQFRYLPDPAYLRPLLAQLERHMASTRVEQPRGPGRFDAEQAHVVAWRLDTYVLSQPVWALAVLRARPPGRRWMALWADCTKDAAPALSPQCVAHTIWALPRLGLGPTQDGAARSRGSSGAAPPMVAVTVTATGRGSGGGAAQDVTTGGHARAQPDLALASTQPGAASVVDAPLMEALLRRTSQLLPELRSSELSMIADGLSQLRYRPSDLWLAALTEHMGRRMGDMHAPDAARMVAALAALCAPVDAEWLDAVVRLAGRAWLSLDVDAMAQLMWGLAQYGVRPDRREWWEGFWRTSEARWQGASGTGLAMLTLALAELVTDAPPRAWQRGLLRAMRLALPRPARAADLPDLLRRASGMAPGEPLPRSRWLAAFLTELARQWGFARLID